MLASKLLKGKKHQGESQAKAFCHWRSTLRSYLWQVHPVHPWCRHLTPAKGLDLVYLPPHPRQTFLHLLRVPSWHYYFSFKRWHRGRGKTTHKCGYFHNTAQPDLSTLPCFGTSKLGKNKKCFRAVLQSQYRGTTHNQCKQQFRRN